MIHIDGTFGEGGGQILRTALGLSLYTGRSFTINNIRGKRKKPGLLRQHLTAVHAAAEISKAQVSGDEISSDTITFIPGQIRGGNYHFAVGTAGSATLVLQAILPGLLRADTESTIDLEGGTHNPMAPPYDFLERSFLPVLQKMGIKVESCISSYGFYPAGGGRFYIRIEPQARIKSIDLSRRGKIIRQSTRVLYAKINNQIALGEMKMIKGRLNLAENNCVTREVSSPGPGNAAFVVVESGNITYTATAFGEKRVSRKQVVSEVCSKTSAYLSSDAAVCEHLADQILIPMALAGGGRFTTVEPSLHTTTNAEIIKMFLPVSIGITKLTCNTWEISLRSTDK